MPHAPKTGQRGGLGTVGEMETGTLCVLGAACGLRAMSVCRGGLGSFQSWWGGLIGPSPMGPPLIGLLQRDHSDGTPV